MANNSGNNKINIPEARQSMYNMKHEVASELGVNLKQGYNGDLTSRQAGSIGGSMVKKMIEAQERSMSGQQPMR
ncbi:small, acid-soluble spore protein, alpha/beta type [Bacillota bacterium Meth-B3]|nr:alpha/beta-type small acid-soluble spore protein [Christensenellaceae bacterium]MEA5068052.1 alpha/beta-type small acid-soluble spore protein [Christensenellaceae bacterium]